MRGPKLWLDVSTTLIVPMTAVRSLGKTAEARKAERGATSIDCVQERRTRKRVARGKEEGIGIKAREMVEGRCVNTIVYRVSQPDPDREVWRVWFDGLP